MASIGSMKQLEDAHTEIRKAVGSIQAKVETASNVNDFSVDANEERELLQQTIADLAKESAARIRELKTRRNALLPINRLSAELLAYIVLLTHTSREYYVHPYLRYTWVCRHWRSALIRSPSLWTVIRHWRHQLQPAEPFYEELLRRSESAELDIELSTNSVPYIPTLKRLFTEESKRICRLRLANEYVLLHLALLGKQFPSLRRLALFEYNYYPDPERSFIPLVPVLLASDHLETLECNVWGNTPVNQLAPIFNRIRNLSLFMESLSVAPHVFDLLHNSNKLQTLQIKNRYIKSNLKAGSSRQVNLPELQYLSVICSSILEYFKAPKLSSMDATWRSTGLLPLDLRALEDFDCLSIRYLYIRGPENQGKNPEDHICFLGAKERLRCNTLFSQDHKIFYEDPFSHVYSRDCFHFSFGRGQAFTTMVQAISSTLHRLTGLVEVYFLIPHSTVEFEELVTRLPSVEKLVVQRGNELLEVIHRINKNPSPCPRLKHLDFKTFVLPENLENYRDDVGRALTEWLKSRKKNCVNKLEYLDLRNCPPLSNTWLDQLQDLGTTVITERSVERVKAKIDRETIRQEGKLAAPMSDVDEYMYDVDSDGGMEGI